MSSSKLTLIGLYNFYESKNKDLFEKLTFPEGIDRDTVISNILLRGGEFEVIYSDPEFIYNSCSVFTIKWKRTFEKWLNALNTEYDPLYNYDRHEEWTDTGTESKNGSTSDTESRSDSMNTSITRNRSVTDTTTNTGSETNENKKSAFDSSDYSPYTKDEISSTNSTTGSTTTSDTDNGTDTNNGKTERSGSTSENRNTGGTHTGHLYGNIGVTTSQQMLQAELNIARWNLYEHIADLFLSEYVIPIY